MHTPLRTSCLLAAIAVATGLLPLPAQAQRPGAEQAPPLRPNAEQPAAQAPAADVPAAEGPVMMRLTLPDTVTLNVLADLTSTRLGIRIIYDDEIRQQKISLKAPAEIPEESLLPLLESILKIKGFALVDADVEGWKRIVKAGKLANIARPSTNVPFAEMPPTEAITQAFALKHTTPARIEEIIKPFLSEPGIENEPVDPRL